MTELDELLYGTLIPETRDYTQPANDVFRTGILGVDYLLHGGFLRGCIAEVTGEERSGKSTIAYQTAATAQRDGHRVAWVAVREQDFVSEYAQTCGVDLDELLVVTPTTIDAALTMVETILRSQAISLVVLEDLCRGTRAREEGEHVGFARSLCKTDARELSALTTQLGKTLLLTTDTTLGWVRSHPFWISQRLHVVSRSRSAIDVYALVTPEGHVGHGVHVPLLPAIGVNHAWHLIQLGVATGIVEEKHAYYRYQGETLGHGIQQVTERLVARPDIVQALWRALGTADCNNALFRAVA